MASQKDLNDFKKIYDETYYDVLRYIVIKCHNINDANDILQETYIELWKKINKNNFDEINIKNFIIGIV